VKSWSIALGLCAALFFGCAPSEPLEQKISAGSDLDFEMWESSHVPSLSPTHHIWYQHALKELQLHVVTELQGAGAQRQRANLLASIDGKTLREVLIRGYELGNERLDVLLDDQRILYRGHADLLPRPRTTAEGAARVRATMDQIEQQIAELERQKRENSEVLRALRISPETVARNP
jgi:hypothetical protein